MLKFLVGLSGGQPQSVDVDRFYAQYPNSQSTLDALNTLKARGYISYFFSDNMASEITVERKAISYFNKQ